MTKLTGPFLVKRTLPPVHTDARGQRRLFHVESTGRLGHSSSSGVLFVGAGYAQNAALHDSSGANASSQVAPATSRPRVYIDPTDAAAWSPPAVPIKSARSPWYSPSQVRQSMDGIEETAFPSDPPAFGSPRLPSLAQASPKLSARHATQYGEALARWQANERASKHSVSRLWGAKKISAVGNEAENEHVFSASSSTSALAGPMASTHSAPSNLGSSSSRGFLDPANLNVVELACELNKYRAQTCRGPRMATLPKPTATRGAIPAWDSKAKDGLLNKDINLSALRGLVSRCPRCTLAFQREEKSRFCNFCGEARIENKCLGETLLAYIGKRSILRYTDLTKMAQHLRSLGHASDDRARHVLHKVSKEIQCAFSHALDFQLSEGNPHSNGLTFEYFPIFLHRLSSPRNITLQELIIFLMEEIRGQVHKKTFEDVVDGSSHDPASEKMKAVRAVADVCVKCGSSKLGGEKLCRKCGYKMAEDESQKTGGAHASTSRHNLFTAVAAKRVQPTEVDVNNVAEDKTIELVSLARQYDMPMDDVRQSWQEFIESDKTKCGSLTYSEFLGAVHRHCNMAADERVPDELSSMLTKTNYTESTGVRFEDFLFWSYLTQYSEAMLVTDPQERRLRQLARDNHLSLSAVENIKAVFDHQSDSRSCIDEDAFSRVLLKLMQSKDPADLCNQKVRRYWREALLINDQEKEASNPRASCINMKGSMSMKGSVGGSAAVSSFINFDEFSLWYVKRMTDR